MNSNKLWALLYLLCLPLELIVVSLLSLQSVCFIPYLRIQSFHIFFFYNPAPGFSVAAVLVFLLATGATIEIFKPKLASVCNRLNDYRHKSE
jgi:hypothetical protein